MREGLVDTDRSASIGGPRLTAWAFYFVCVQKHFEAAVQLGQSAFFGLANVRVGEREGGHTAAGRTLVEKEVMDSTRC